MCVAASQLRQFGDTISFRDLDFQRPDDVYAGDADVLARDGHLHHPRPIPPSILVHPWSLELLVRRQTGPIKKCLQRLRALPVARSPICQGSPAEGGLAAAEEAARPMWAKIWYPEERADRHHRPALLLRSPPSCSSRIASPMTPFPYRPRGLPSAVHPDLHRLACAGTARWSPC